VAAERAAREELVRWLVFMPVDDAWASRLALATRAELEWTLRELEGRPLVVGKIKRLEARLRRGRDRAWRAELTESAP
jgi:hypothetical protein